MNDIVEGLITAAGLLAALDADLLEITLRSLHVSLTATLIASAIGLPLGAWLAINRFRLRRVVIALLNALMGLPPVVVGLFVYVLFSRAGPLGVLGLLFTPAAMIVAQVIIITPIIASIAHQAIRELWADYHDLLISLNATRRQRIAALLWDGRRPLMTASLAGFGRAIGEVGAIMIVGGNIDNATRVLTTAIALETGKGEFGMALALGFVLIGLAIAVNLALHMLSRTEQGQPVVSPILPLTLEEVELYRRGRRILGPVSWTLAGDGLTVLMGPNGSGKTSLLKAMHGLERISRGRVAWSGDPVAVRARQAFVFQTPILMRRSVLDCIAFPLRLDGVRTAEARARAEEQARWVGLTVPLGRPAEVLSGGEKQKLALARAFIRAPDVLFLDEPCANLDGRSTREIEAILKAARAGGTRIVMSTHDVGQARRLADEVLFLHEGRVLEAAPHERFFAGPVTPEAAAHIKGELLP